MSDNLYSHLTPPSRPDRERKRERRHACGTSPEDGRYLRYPGKGDKIQLRFWLGGLGSVNCGLYESEMIAKMVRREMVREMGKNPGKYPGTPLGLWQALRCVLARLGERAGEVSDALPMWVRVAPGGYSAMVKKSGRVLECGPFTTPEAAHLAMVELIAVEFPRRAKSVVRESRWEVRSLTEYLVA